MYSRQSVHVEWNDGSVLPCEAYVARPEFMDHLETFDWDFDEFLRSGKNTFLMQHREFMDL